MYGLSDMMYDEIPEDFKQPTAKLSLKIKVNQLDRK